MDTWSLILGAILGYVINEIFDLIRSYLNKALIGKLTTERQTRQFMEKIVAVTEIIDEVEEKYGEGHGEEKLSAAVQAVLSRGYAESAMAAALMINEVFALSRYYHR